MNGREIRVLNVPAIRWTFDNLEFRRLGAVAAGYLDADPAFVRGGASLVVKDLRPVVVIALLQDDQSPVEFCAIHVVARSALL